MKNNQLVQEILKEHSQILDVDENWISNKGLVGEVLPVLRKIWSLSDLDPRNFLDYLEEITK